MPMLCMDTAQEFDYIAYDPHDRVRGHHYSESGGNPRTAYIISTRHEIEKLRAAGAYVDADTMEAALEQFIWNAFADHYHYHYCASLTLVHDDLSPAPQLEVEPDKQQFNLTTLKQNLKERAHKMNDHKPRGAAVPIDPGPRGAAVRPEDRFFDELHARGTMPRSLTSVVLMSWPTSCET